MTLRQQTWLPWVLATALVSLHLGVVAWHGALGASRNDDWTYLRILADLDSTGRFVPDPYTRTMLVGQVWLSRPVVELFGLSITALQVTVALVGAVGLVAAVAVLRRFLTLTWALFAIGVLALGPVYGTVAVSFMSDVPAMTLQFLALYLGLRAIEAGPRWAWLLALSLVTAFVGFTIREYAVVAFIAVLLAFLLLRRDRIERSRLLVLTCTVLWVVAAASLFSWRTSLAAGSAGGIDVASVTETLKMSIQSVVTMAALLLPAVVLLWRPSLWQRNMARWWAMCIAVCVVLAQLVTSGSILVGNYLTRLGSYAVTLPGVSPETVSGTVWGVLIGLTALAFATLAVRTVNGLRSLESLKAAELALRDAPPALLLSGVFGVVGLGVVLLGGAASSATTFDRYLIPYIPFLAGWVVWAALPAARAGPTSSRSRHIVAPIALSLWAVVGLHYVDVAATFDGAKRRMGETLVDAGYAPGEIDAGLEWFGLHQDGDVRLPVAFPRGGLGFWHALFDSPRVCVVASHAGHAINGSGTVVAAVDARSVLGTEYALVAREIDVNCSSPR